MKKYFAGFIAVTAAVICFAFTPTPPATGTDCTTANYWFHVTNGANLTDCNAVALGNLDLVDDPNQNGVIDNGELDAALGVKKLPTQSPAGCPDIDTKICALSFTAAQIVVFQDIDGTYRFKPSSLAYKCCVKRTQP